MKFEHYLKRVESSEEFKEFKKKHKDFYLCAGFFVLDFSGGKDVYQIDYFLKNNKIASFLLNDKVEVKIVDQTVKQKMEKISRNVNLDLDEIKGIVEDEMKNKIVTEKLLKIIAVLHIMDGKLIWNLQCILSGLVLLSIHIDDSDKTILKFYKHSLLEIMKKV